MASEKLQEIKTLFAQKLGMKTVDETKSLKDLGLDSLDVVELSFDLEDRYGISLDPEKLSTIKTVADLKGKSVSIGAAGSGVYFNAMDVLGAYGLTEADIKPTYQSFGDSADALKDGKIDAAFIVAGAPTTAITDLATTKDVGLVSLDDEHITTLLANSDYYSKTVIAKDVYFAK